MQPPVPAVAAAVPQTLGLVLRAAAGQHAAGRRAGDGVTAAVVGAGRDLLGELGSQLGYGFG